MIIVIGDSGCFANKMLEYLLAQNRFERKASAVQKGASDEIINCASSDEQRNCCCYLLSHTDKGTNRPNE